MDEEELNNLGAETEEKVREILSRDEYEARKRSEGNDQYEELQDNDLAFQ